MASNLDRYRTDLQRLAKIGAEMRQDLALMILEQRGKLTEEQARDRKKVDGAFAEHYQRWYTEAAALIRQVIPDRLGEFCSLYAPDPKRKGITLATYRIQDMLYGIGCAKDPFTGKKPFDELDVGWTRFLTQLKILDAAKARFESSLLEIRQLVQADIFDSEIDAAKELARSKFTRAAGALAGVVLEGHLAQVCENHKVKITKSSPGIADLNDALKNAGVIEVPEWRFVQHLGDIRNLCDHSKKADPTPGQVDELIAGVAKVTKILF